MKIYKELNKFDFIREFTESDYYNDIYSSLALDKIFNYIMDDEDGDMFEFNIYDITQRFIEYDSIDDFKSDYNIFESVNTVDDLIDLNVRLIKLGSYSFILIDFNEDEF